MKKDYAELGNIMETCSDVELYLYRSAIMTGIVNFQDVQTGEVTLENSLEVFDCITMELIYRGKL